jgi:competence protein ComEC
VREVWIGPGWDPLGCAGQLMTLPGVRLRILWAGERAAVGRWDLLALHPDPGEHRGTNERSLVLRAESAGVRLLLTGDVERWAESRLLAAWPAEDLRTDLLKVAHHGSRTSTGESFLATVALRLALISAGPRNLYHPPSPVVLDCLEERGIRILRTDRDGLVLVRFSRDGRMRLGLPGVPR